MTKRKKVTKAPKPKTESTLFRAVCSDCKIRLIVKKDNTEKCYLCKSVNITVTPWN